MRFFIFIILFSKILFAESASLNFTEKQLDPFLHQASDQISIQLYLLGAASVLLTQPQDDSIRSQWMQNRQMTSQQSKAGDILGSGLGSGVVLISQFYFDSNKNNFESHLRGAIYSTVITSTMKVAFSKKRPGSSQNYHSFPSGHTAISFLTATNLYYSYGWKAAAIAYPLAAFVGLSRLSDDAHWASDVVAGAFIGFIIGRASYFQSDSGLASSHQSSQSNLIQKSQFFIVPELTPEKTGLQISFLF